MNTEIEKYPVNKTRDWCMRIAIILVGSIIYGIGVSFFISEQNLLTGGVAGIALLISNIIPESSNAAVNSIFKDAGIWTIILNLPLIVAGMIVFGKKYMFMTILGTLVSSLSITLFEFLNVKYNINLFEGEAAGILMCGILGGALAGFGRALIFRVGSNTGGTDIITKFVRLKYQNFSAGKIFLVFDGVLVLIHTIIRKDIELGLYTAITLSIANVLFDKVMFGFDSAKMFFIITDKKEELREHIIREINAGVTILSASGGYTNEHKDVLMVAIKKHLYPRLKEVVKDCDPHAFFIVSQASEIYGKGFKENDNKKQA